MKLSVRSIAFDFLFGGVIVVGALLVASLLGPTAGGILAGAPIRSSSVIFLQYLHQDIKSATELTRGVVFAMIANVFFACPLPLSPKVRSVGSIPSRRCSVHCSNSRNEADGFNLGISIPAAMAMPDVQ